MGRTAAHWAASRAQPCLVLLQRAGFVGGPAMHQSRSHGRFCEILNAYLRAAAPAADPGRIGKPSERIYGTGLHPPPKKMGKGCFWDSLTRIVACYGFYVKGERAFLGVDVFCDVCCKTFLVKTFHPNLVDYFRGVSLIGSGFVEVVRVLKFSFIQLRFEKKGMYH